MPNNLAVSYGQSSGYPNPTYFLGSFATDPANTSSGQWWYNATTLQIKENINGSIQVLGAFASAFSSTTYITSDTTIGGQGITVNYLDLVVTNNATLTVAAGSNVNVAGAVNITAGASLVLQGATVNVYNALQNAGTLQSTSSSDSIQAVQVQNTGIMQIDGTLYLPNAGYNHILAGTVSGTGTLNIQGTAITLISDQLSLSISTVSGTGTYQVQQNGVCTINGNIAMSLANVTGAGMVSVASGYTLTVVGNSTLSVSNISGTGTLSISSTYTLTIAGNTAFSISTVAGEGTIAINSGYTLTVAGNVSSTISLITGAGTLSVSSGYTLTFNASSTLAIGGDIEGAGTLSVASGYTLSVGNSSYPHTTLTIANVTGTGAINSTGTVTYIAGNSTWSVATIGGGVWQLNSGVTVTQGFIQGLIMTWSMDTFYINGTWANNGHILAMGGGVQYIYVSGSVTTTTTPGNLIVNGTVFWWGNGITAQTTNAMPTFVLSLTGTGILLASPTNANGTATNSIPLSTTVIAYNNTDGYTTGTGNIPYMTFTSVTGSVTGEYGIGIYDSTASTYAIFILIYLGSTNDYNLPSGYNLNYTVADKSGDTIYVFNASDSAGIITLTGTAYV